jgi:copper chaperone CopZ
MKTLLRALALSLVSGVTVFAGDITYEGQITGVVCGACKEHVTEALMKVDGIKSVEIAPTNVPEIRHITIKGSKENFSATDANNALAAAHGENYKVTKLDKKS